jgi:hypothetical protein
MKTWSTRLDDKSGHKVSELMREASMTEAEVVRRLIMIGLKSVKEPADLLGK